MTLGNTLIDNGGYTPGTPPVTTPWTPVTYGEQPSPRPPVVYTPITAPAPPPGNGIPVGPTPTPPAPTGTPAPTAASAPSGGIPPLFWLAGGLLLALLMRR